MKDRTSFPYRKILIVGCGGAGKSTLAVALGKKLALPVVHLDKLWWKPGWQSRTESEFDALLLPELEKPSWIIEGNFARTFARRLEHAELCIFLDYPTELCINSVYERAKIPRHDATGHDRGLYGTGRPRVRGVDTLVRYRRKAENARNNVGVRRAV